MKKSLQRTMLFLCALVLGMGQSWASGATTVPVRMTYIDGGNVDAAAGQVDGPLLLGYMKWSGDQVACANAGWGCNNVAYLEVDASAIEGIITKVTLDAVFDEATGGKRDVEVQASYNESEWSDALTWSTANRTINWLATFKVSRSGGAGQAGSFDITKAFTGENKKVTILMYGMAAAGTTLTAVPTVNVSYATADEITSYTVKYVDAEGNELKESKVYAGQIIGAEASATDEEMASFVANDKKYIYVSGNEIITLAKESESNVISLVFREAAVYNFSIVSNIGTTIFEGTGFEGDNVDYFAPYYILNDGTLYGSPSGLSYGKGTIALDADAKVVTINYTADEMQNAVFYSEAENINTLTAYQDGYTEIRMSNGAVAYAEADGTEITTLAPGKYTLTSSTRAGSTTFSAAGNTILALSSTGAVANATSSEFTLYGNADVTVSKGDTKNYFDYVLIRKTGDVTEEEILAANETAALADMAWWEGLCGELTAAMKDNEEYILPDTRTAILDFMKEDYYPSAINAAYEDANENKTAYVCPFDKALIESQVRGWIAEIEGIKNGTIALYTETGVVGDATLNSEMPYFATPVTTEVYVDKVVLKGWDGTEGSDLTVRYTKIAQNEEVTLSITGIEQTVNGEVVSELNDEGETPYVMLQPQSGAYSMIGIDVLNEDGMTGIQLGEGGGVVYLYGQFFPIPNIGGEEDNMGVEEPIEAIYAVTWPGQEIINAVAWNRIKAQIANVEEAIANYDAIVSKMYYASRIEGDEFNAAVDAAREWVSTTTETYKAKYEAGTLTAEDGVKGDMMEQTMAVNDALNAAAKYDITRYVQSAVYYWMGDEDEIVGQKKYVESVIETMSGPGKTALEEQVALLDAALQILTEDWEAYTLYSPEKHQELIDRAEGIKLSITDIVEQAEEAVGINNATVNATSTGAVYNLAGQKVSSNYNGIVVKNGKKVIVK